MRALFLWRFSEFCRLLLLIPCTPSGGAAQRRPRKGAAVAFLVGDNLKIRVYIDGFNFYYGAVRRTPYKWLDFSALCKRLFPSDEVVKIKYFTARISATPNDPDAPTRQDVFLKALAIHCQNLEIIEGYFLTSPATFPSNPSGKLVRVFKTEEKGSDVNLAVHLLNDAWKREFESALVISNDSDLAEAIQLVKTETGLPVGVLNPRLGRKAKMAHHLNRVASYRKRLTVSGMSSCQLPNPIPGTNLFKPSSW